MIRSLLLVVLLLTGKAVLLAQCDGCGTGNDCSTSVTQKDGSTDPNLCEYPSNGGCSTNMTLLAVRGAGYSCCIPNGESPIVIDVEDKGFHLTSAQNGVMFDFFGNGTFQRLSWTEPGAGNAWLVLDRNGNGLIDNATEMFGNFTPQPPSKHPNGFLALAVFDSFAYGGNEDGVISAKDAIFTRLRLWQDANHNGISEPEELHTLPELGVDEISLKFEEDREVDAFGNRFRYRALVRSAAGLLPDRWAYDVFVVALPSDKDPR
jgi:hypothetical protein